MAASYRIVVHGRIDRMWCEALGGLALAEQCQPGQPTITQLEGTLADQSALHGVLDTLFMLGLVLFSVERLPADKTVAGPDA